MIVLSSNETKRRSVTQSAGKQYFDNSRPHLESVKRVGQAATAAGESGGKALTGLLGAGESRRKDR